MTGRLEKEVAPPPLVDEDRHHGRVALNLIGAWDEWVKRRVETVQLVSDTTVKRSVSVDFRLHSWLPEPVLDWDDRRVHYIPVALLSKGRMLRFDLRDEAGHALPLVTRRKNALISASALAALAQMTVWTAMGERVGFSRLLEGGGFPDDPRRISLPRHLEDDFFRIAYLAYHSKRDEPSSRNVLDTFLGTTPSSVVRPWEWAWQRDASGDWVFNDETPWRYELARDDRMRGLLTDLARVWPVCVPIQHEPRQRRIIKFSYLEHIMQPQLHAVARIKDVADDVGAGAILGRVEDRLEGLSTDAAGLAEWEPRHSLRRRPPRISLRTQVAQALAWKGHVVKLDAPAVGNGGSYHLQMDAPDGTQIRRATLAAMKGDSVQDSDAIRGVRSLQHAHLHLDGIVAGAQGSATLMLKPRTSTIVRALALLAIGAFAMLLAARWKLDALTDVDHPRAAALAPIFLLFPGLGAAAVARTTEHAMTTSMLFGLRCLAIGVAACPLAGASLLALARFWPQIGLAWWVLVGVSGALMLATLVSWRLAARRRPGGWVP